MRKVSSARLGTAARSSAEAAEASMLEIAVAEFDNVLVRSRFAVAKCLYFRFRAAEAEHVEHRKIDFKLLAPARRNLDVHRLIPFELDLLAVDLCVRWMKLLV